MRRSLLVAPALAVALLGSVSTGEEKGHERFLAVTDWTVRLDVRLSDSREEKGDGTVVTAKRSVTLGGTAEVARNDDADPPFGHWEGELKGSGSVALDESTTDKDGATLSFTTKASGSLSDASVNLRLDAKAGTYELDVKPGALQGRGTAKGPGGEPADFDAPQSLVFGDWKTLHLPATGLRITGSCRLPATCLAATLSAALFAERPSEFEVSWTIAPKGTEEMELVYSVVGRGVGDREKPALIGYDDWIPEGSGDEERPGNELVIKAELRNKSGKTPVHGKASGFRFELVECSEEPGVCMNRPLAGKKRHDLRFLQSKNALVKVDDEKTASTPKGVDGTEATATLSCFDYGAWGKLRVTAVVDGQPLVGHLEADESRGELLIPKRAETSKIADAWKKKYPDPGNPSDDDDGELAPAGDGCPGDGLTLYEEYRGFYEDGRHVRTSPRTKDVFILNSMGQDGDGGVALFADLTKLSVHGRLRADELDVAPQSPTSNAIDPNQGDGPHHPGMQHALVLVAGPSRGTCQGFRRDGQTIPGMPREFLRVQVCGPYPFGADERASNVAHELLHACNVPHHGQFAGEEGTTEWFAKQGHVWERVGPHAGQITVNRESDGKELLPAWVGKKIVLLPVQGAADPTVDGPIRTLRVGHQEGVYSGAHDCVMRYYAAEAYISFAQGTRRYVFDVPNGEIPGTSLCSGKDDSGGGVNHPDHKPRPRYGAATTGGCKNVFCVNDSKH